MDNRGQMHKAEVTLLNQLRHVGPSRFSELMRPTGLESDVFKFHIRKMVKFGYIEKNNDGRYSLTARGKIYANIIDIPKRNVRNQARLNVMIVVTKKQKGKDLFLVQKRLRSPLAGYWTPITGPTTFGVELLETARYELFRETGLEASFNIKSFYQLKAYLMNSDELLAEYLFIVIEANKPKGELDDSWYKYGKNKWVTLDEYQKLKQVIISGKDLSDALDKNIFITRDLHLEI